MTERPATVAALFVRSDSVYKSLTGVDAWDIERDATTWPGGCPVVAHPPCRAWASLRHCAKPRPGERELAVWAIGQVRLWGGVLEHPHRSQLWPEMDLPTGVQPDAWGGWTLTIDQHWWGHRAQKRTRLYIVGCPPAEIPSIPLRIDEPTHTVGLWSGRDRARARPGISKSEHEATPPALAAWLVELARRCGRAPCVITGPGRRADGSRLRKGEPGWRPKLRPDEREHTPPAFAAWLVELARRCGRPSGSDLSYTRPDRRQSML